MRPARLIALVVALGAAAGAAFLLIGRSPPQTPTIAVEAPPQPLTEDILVAANTVAMGNSVKATDIHWRAWPRDSIPPEATRRSELPGADKDFAGMMSRTTLVAGQPIFRGMLVASGGFLSAILPAGKRAIAVSIDNRGGTSAGNFIFPNDRVDVIRTTSGESDLRVNGGEAVRAETILRNVRVLAIGENVDRREGEKTSSGTTATLEVLPLQAELITKAQKGGQLVLALRSSADTDADMSDQQNLLTVVRFGLSQTSSK